MLGLKKIAIRTLIQLSCLLFSTVMLGQNAKAIYTDRPIEIDGIIEDTWEKAQNLPILGILPRRYPFSKEQTQVKILFDDALSMF